MSVKCKHLNDIIFCENAIVHTPNCPFAIDIYAKACCKGHEPKEEPLKACPFCGSDKIDVCLFDEDEDGQEWIVECKNPGCHAKRNVTFWTKKLAIKHWNTRVQQ